MWQLGQIAETMSTSSEISPAQPLSLVGSEVVEPVWLTFEKHPLAVVQAGRPYWERYVARSDSAFGSLYASTIATVTPLAPDVDRLYALCRSGGPNPDGVASGLSEIGLARSVRRNESQDITCALLGTAHDRVTFDDRDGVWAARAGVAVSVAAVNAAAAPIRISTGGLTLIFSSRGGHLLGLSPCLWLGRTPSPLMDFSCERPRTTHTAELIVA